jgi:hypothetical protein
MLCKLLEVCFTISLQSLYIFAIQLVQCTLHFAIALQLFHNRFAIALQSLYRFTIELVHSPYIALRSLSSRRFAVASLSLHCRFTVAKQSLRCRFVIASQSLCCRFAVASNSLRCRLADALLSLRCRFAVASNSLRCRLADALLSLRYHFAVASKLLCNCLPYFPSTLSAIDSHLLIACPLIFNLPPPSLVGYCSRPCFASSPLQLLP